MIDLIHKGEIYLIAPLASYLPRDVPFPEYYKHIIIAEPFCVKNIGKFYVAVKPAIPKGQTWEQIETNFLKSLRVEGTAEQVWPSICKKYGVEPREPDLGLIDRMGNWFAEIGAKNPVVKEELKVVVEEAVEKHVASHPETTGAIQLLNRINDAWTWFSEAHILHSVAPALIGGGMAGLIVNTTRSPTTDRSNDETLDMILIAGLTGSVSALLAKLVHLYTTDYNFFWVPGESDKPATQTQLNQQIEEYNLLTFFTGTSGVVLSGALIYKIYNLIKKRSVLEAKEEKPSMFTLVADVLIAAASIVGLVGCAFDPKILRSIASIASAAIFSLKQARKLPGLVKDIITFFSKDDLFGVDSPSASGSDGEDDDDKDINIPPFEGTVYADPVVVKHMREGCLERVLEQCRKYSVDIDEGKFNVELFDFSDCGNLFVKNINSGNYQFDEDMWKAYYHDFVKGTRNVYWENDKSTRNDFADGKKIRLVVTEFEEKEENPFNANEGVQLIKKSDDWFDSIRNKIKSVIDLEDNRRNIKAIGTLAALVVGVAVIAGGAYMLYDSVIDHSKCACGNDKKPKFSVCKDCKNKKKSTEAEDEGRQKQRNKTRGDRIRENQQQNQKVEDDKNLAKFKQWLRNTYEDSEREELEYRFASDPRFWTTERQIRWGDLMDQRNRLEDALDEIASAYGRGSGNAIANKAQYSQLLTKLGKIAHEFTKFYKWEGAEQEALPAPASRSGKKVPKPGQDFKSFVGANKLRSCDKCAKEFKSKKFTTCPACFHKALNEKKAKEPQVQGDKPSAPAPKALKKCSDCDKSVFGQHARCSDCHAKFITSQADKAREAAVKDKPQGKSEATSKYRRLLCTAKQHEALITLYNPRSDHPDKFFGCMLKGKYDGKTSFFINKHQLLEDVYIKDASNKNVPIFTKNWTVFKENGSDTIFSAPGDSFQVQGAAIAIGAFGAGSSVQVLTLMGRQPEGMSNFTCSTNAHLDGNYIVHSADTENLVCGAFLWDSEREVAVGLHTRTDGPNRNGGNNHAVHFF